MSLTFDDSRPVHLDVAVPELNKRHLHATFFVIISKLTRLDGWREAQAEGHEIGNHSLTHEHVSALTQASEELQVEDAKAFLDSNFHANTIIFAYPYSELSPGLSFWVQRYDFLARGWQGSSDSPYISAEDLPDWYNLPSQATNTDTDVAVYKDWIDKALAMHAWTIVQIHGIGDPSTGFDPIPTPVFLSFLDYLRSKEANGLWIAPMGTVGAYLRGQKILETAKTEVESGGEKWVWELPVPFPSGVLLRARILAAHSKSRPRIYQGKRELHASKSGVYTISLDARELMIRPAP
ncbi:MAG: polysaccharide deacetylase family protein [Acidobacteria bacterium]|nr:polysaccharide deacetylase family protein [Acidobacteriota bacterium]